MTVNDQTSKITYAGNGSTTVWTFPFASDDPSSIFLFITDSVGHITQVAVGQYTVALNAPVPPNPTSLGGTVTYPIAGPPLAAGNKLSIVRLTPDLQTTSITNQSIIYPPVVEQEFDYRTMVDQQLQEMIARSVKVGIGDDPMPPLPPTELRKNLQAIFDADGNLTAGGAVIGAIISAAMMPVVTAATLALARQNMGVPPIDSPIFTGDPRAPKAGPTDNDTSIATTEWVQSYVSINGGAVPSGTRVLFQQTTAPAGWTKDTTHHDKALRVVNGTVGSGGVTGFSTVFSYTATDPTILTVAQMPVHGHALSDPGHTHTQYAVSADGTGPGVETKGIDTSVPAGTGSLQTAIGFTNANIFNTGGGQSHSHGIDTRVLYVDIIICQKD